MGAASWTWCAYDILGIFGVTGATGRAVSPGPTDGRPIMLDFRRGRPDQHDAVLFYPDEKLMILLRERLRAVVSQQQPVCEQGTGRAVGRSTKSARQSSRLG